MKKYIITLSVFVVILTLGSFVNYSNADITVDGMITQGDSFISTGETQEDINTMDGSRFSKMVKQIYRVLFTIGVAVSVVVSGIIGIKIMLGSAEEKAEIKEKMVPFVIGCIVMFGAFAFWKIVMIIAGNIS